MVYANVLSESSQICRLFTGAEDTENIVAEAEIVVEQKEVQKYVEEAGGQFVLPIEIAS